MKNTILIKSKVLKVFLLFGIIFGATVDGFSQTNVYTNVIATSPDHTYLNTALINTGLSTTLQNPNADFTVFAPTDDAIDSLASRLGITVNDVLALNNLQAILEYHVVADNISSSAIVNGTTTTPVNDTNTLKLTKTTGGTVFVNQAQVIDADLTADNGVVHSIDAALLFDETVIDIAIDNGFSTLVTAVNTARLTPTLSDPFAEFTVFAPTNAAFDTLAVRLNTNLNGILALGNLADVLTYHVLGSEVLAADINNGDIVDAVSTSNTLKLTKTSTGEVYVNQAKVTTANVSASNGVVHIIDAAVLPNETVVDVALDNGFTTLATAVVQQELLPVLTDPFAEFTVFAPTNDAFDTLAVRLNTDLTGILNLANLTDVITYHVLGSEVLAADINNGDIVDAVSPTNTLKLTKTSTGSVFVNQAQVTTADVAASNGIVHVLDAVVLPNETVVDVALDNGFTTLATAVVQQELIPTLSDPFAKFTVFAPTNDAFDTLAVRLNTDLNGILGLSNLTDVLTYHVLGSEVLAANINNGDIVDAVSTTNTLKLTKTSTGSVFVNQAQVTTADVAASNGVVHILDAVVLPNETVVDVALDNGFTTLATAVVQQELIPTLSDPFSKFTVFAPNNDAFDTLAVRLNTDLNGILGLSNLTDVLTYHVLDQEVMASAVTSGIAEPISTSNTLKLTKTSTNDVFVNHAQVILADVSADNGVVHVLDEVVLPNRTVVDVAVDNGFTYLATAVVQQELAPALSDPFANYTVFAPTNDAFDTLAVRLNTDLAGVLALGNLADVLTYHVLDGEVMAADVNSGVVSPLSSTNTLKLTKTTMGEVFVNQAQVTTADVAADNGIIHVLDEVVLPNKTVVDVAIDNGFTSLTTAVVQQELVPTLSEPFAKYTVFAPTNDAFDTLAVRLNTDLAGVLNTANLTDILTYHVLGSEVMAADVNSGVVSSLSSSNTLKVTKTSTGDVFVNQAQVTLADVAADNGVVHVLDEVVLPIETVVDVAIDNEFDALTTAVVQQELLPALTDPFAELTVFAPTDEAFENLATSLNTDLAGVLELENLTDVLLYHVLGETVLSTELTAGAATTLSGDDINIAIGSDVVINSSVVTTPDITSGNGVVHVLDKVLLQATASTEIVELKELTIFPNPASSNLNVVSGDDVLTSVSVLNVQGQVVLSQNPNAYSTNLDVSGLTPGMYILDMRSNDKVSRKNIVIAK